MNTEAICDHCGEEIYVAEGYYHIDGQVVCADCAADYAQKILMRPYWVGGCDD